MDYFTVPCAILKGSQAFASKWGCSWPCNDRDLFFHNFIPILVSKVEGDFFLGSNDTKEKRLRMLVVCM
jgi:hypothetical protein